MNDMLIAMIGWIVGTYCLGIATGVVGFTVLIRIVASKMEQGEQDVQIMPTEKQTEEKAKEVAERLKRGPA